PAVLFILLGAMYTFLFGKKFYTALHGWLAVIILITAEHIIISNQDVRAEPFMTGLMIMGLYHFARVISAGSNRQSAIGSRQSAIGNRQSAVGSRQSPDLVILPQAGSAEKKSVIANNPWLHLILGSLAVACLIMTKGLFTIIP